MPRAALDKNGLTVQQEKFAQCIALNGMSQYDAYRTAYNTSATKKTINSRASELVRKSNIAARIDELRGKKAEKEVEIAAEKGIRTKEQSLRRLTEIADNAYNDTFCKNWQAQAAARNTAIKAEQQLSKMLGYDAAEKIDATVTITLAAELEEFAE